MCKLGHLWQTVSQSEDDKSFARLLLLSMRASWTWTYCVWIIHCVLANLVVLCMHRSLCVLVNFNCTAHRLFIVRAGKLQLY